LTFILARICLLEIIPSYIGCLDSHIAVQTIWIANMWSKAAHSCPLHLLCLRIKKILSKSTHYKL
jgi:hypothetical protein